MTNKEYYTEDFTESLVEVVSIKFANWLRSNCSAILPDEKKWFYHYGKEKKEYSTNDMYHIWEELDYEE